MAPVRSGAFQKTLERMFLQNWTSFLDSLHSIGGMRATMSARTYMDAGSDDTRAKRTIWSFLVPADGTGAAAYMERRLRYVPDLWAPWGKTLRTRK